MKKDTESKVVNGALIGGLIGIGAIAVFLVLRKKETSFDHIGKVISSVGEILAGHHIEELAPVKELGKKIHQNENTVVEVVDWIATGISIWKQFKK
jgi:hypothetical protein